MKIDALLDQTPEFSYRAYQQPVLSEPASVPVCETADDALREVIENLTRLQNQESFIRSQNQPLVSSESIIVWVPSAEARDDSSVFKVVNIIRGELKHK